jgi:hypothetical protein
MAPVGTTLTIDGIGLSQRAIGGQLGGATLDKGASRHDQGAIVARGDGGHRVKVGLYRRIALYGAAKSN